MSILETVEHVEVDDLWNPGRHVLTVGQPRSGKTSWLLKCTATYYKMGEHVLVRDIGEFYEWFSMLEHGYKILGLVPKGCRILFEHENFEQVEFDVLNLNTLFDQVDRNRINLVFFESFCAELKNSIHFWSTLFRTLLPWKQKPGNGAKRFTLIIDEFGDIAPGKGRTYLPDQNRLSQLIAMNHRKFRRHNIRLVAAVHYFRDITPPIRERFDCYLINTNYPNPQEVPFSLRKYANLFPKLAVDEVIFLDTAKNFNQIKVKEEIKPKRFYNIGVEGNVDEIMRPKLGNRTEKDRELWKSRTAHLGKILSSEYGWRYGDLAKELRVSERQIRWMFSTAIPLEELDSSTPSDPNRYNTN